MTTTPTVAATLARLRRQAAQTARAVLEPVPPSRPTPAKAPAGWAGLYLGMGTLGAARAAPSITP